MKWRLPQPSSHLAQLRDRFHSILIRTLEMYSMKKLNKRGSALEIPDTVEGERLNKSLSNEYQSPGFPSSILGQEFCQLVLKCHGRRLKNPSLEKWNHHSQKRPTDTGITLLPVKKAKFFISQLTYSESQESTSPLRTCKASSQHFSASLFKMNELPRLHKPLRKLPQNKV